jgi:hypothetical protein
MAFSIRARDDCNLAKPKPLPATAYARPEVEAVDEMLETLKAPPFNIGPRGPRHCIEVTEPERKVMPSDTGENPATQRPDTSPESATRGDQYIDAWPVKSLDLIAHLIGQLTYGEMIELAASIWRIVPEPVGVTADNMSKILHQWAVTHGRQ